MQINNPQIATAAVVLQLENSTDKGTTQYRSTRKVDQHSLIRARFLADSLLTDCSLAIETSKQVSGQSTTPQRETVKELAFVLVFLLGLDEGGANSTDSLQDFLFQTLCALDKLSPSPPSRVLIERLGLYKAERICDRVCALAKAREDLSKPAIAVLRNNEVFERAFRETSLDSALSSAPEAIQAQHVLKQLSDAAA